MWNLDRHDATIIDFLRDCANRKRIMTTKLLGIETSCDETAVAVIDADGRILSNLVRSQLDEHKNYGGVVPEIAARAHLELLPQMYHRAMNDAGISLTDIAAIGVTTGPGLVGGLLVGMMFAAAIGYAAGIPVYGLNHLEGHALTARMTDGVQFPYLLLLVSGGHSQFIIVEHVGRYRRIGTTIDDAVGEAFDKVAKMAGMGYPGGPMVERAAKNGDERRFDFPIPMRARDGCDLSLSGLKTAVRHAAAKLPQPISLGDAADIAASFQYSVGKMLQDRLQNAMDIFHSDYPSMPTPVLAVAGGVAANRYLLEKIQSLTAQNGWQMINPPLNLCGDNAVMMAWAARERLMAGMPFDVGLTARPRWPLDPMAGGKNPAIAV
jgi:N6-L-threonylcarbamoyladenine synthase